MNTFLNVVKIIILFLPFLNQKLIGQTISNLQYSPDGEVNSLIAKGDTLIVGGNFNHVGKFSGGLAMFTNTDDNLDPIFPKVIGSIYSISPDGLGGYYIYGNFRKQSEDLNTGAYRRIEHIDLNGNFDPTVSFAVTQIFQDGKLYYLPGTNFLLFSAATLSKLNGHNCGSFTGINIATGQLLPWVPSITGTNGGMVTEMELSPDTKSLYLLGTFTTIGGQTRTGSAKIKVNSGASDGTITPWNPRPNWDYWQDYKDLVFHNDNIILGGNFGQVANPNGLGHAAAKVDTVSGNTFAYLFRSGGAFGNGNASLYFGANINALAIDGNTLYAFSTGTFDTRISAINLQTVDVFNDVSGYVFNRYFNLIASSVAMKVIDNELIVAGTNIQDIYTLGFDNSNPANIEQEIKCSFKLNKNTGVLEDWFPDVAEFSSNNIRCMVTDGPKVLLGGSFTHANVQDRKGVYAIDTKLNVVLPFAINITNAVFKVNAMKLLGNELFIAGQSLFNTTINNSTAVLYNINTGAQSGWAAPNLGQAFAIEVDNAKVYLGGNLTETGGTRTKLFAIDRTTGALDSWAPNPSANVQTLHIKDELLYIGGDFTSMAGQPRNRAAAFTLPSLTLHNWNPNASATVFTINSKNSNVWLGGSFTQMGGQTRRLFAAVDPITAELRTTPNNTFFGQPIYAFAPMSCEILMGGAFRISNTAQCNGVTAYDIFSKTMVPSSNLCVNINQLGGNINALAFVNNDLYFGGLFSKINGVVQSTNIGRFTYPPDYFGDCDDYTTVQNGNWHNTTTWDSGKVPINKNIAIVKHQVEITANANCYVLQLKPEGKLNFQPFFKLDILGSY